MTTPFDSQRVIDHIRYLTEEIGPRLSGSAADRRAGDYIFNYYKSLGLPTREQPFELPGGEVRSYAFEVTEPALGVIPCFPFWFTADTPPAGLSGELYFLEGVQEPAGGAPLAGKIIIWAETDLHEVLNHYQEVARCRPLAIILLNSVLGVGPMHLQLFDNLPQGYSTVPTLYIAWEDSLRLFQARAKTGRVCLQTDRQRLASRNIFAEVKGSQYPEEIILIGGHYDSVPEGPGALDNASGTATVMELARLAAQRGSRRTIRFAAWGAEEYGLIGSRYYLKELKKQHQEEITIKASKNGHPKTELDNHLCVISLDIVGLALAKDVYFVLGPEPLSSSVSTLIKEQGVWAEVKNAFYGTDAEHFTSESIPSISITSYSSPGARYIHGTRDRLELIDPAHIERCGLLVDTFLTRFAGQASQWPFERKIPEDQLTQARQALADFEWMWHAEE
jgi:aminopeptidase YwaD